MNYSVIFFSHLSGVSLIATLWSGGFTWVTAHVLFENKLFLPIKPNIFWVKIHPSFDQ